MNTCCQIIKGIRNGVKKWWPAVYSKSIRRLPIGWRHSYTAIRSAATGSRVGYSCRSKRRTSSNSNCTCIIASIIICYVNCMYSGIHIDKCVGISAGLRRVAIQSISIWRGTGSSINRNSSVANTGACRGRSGKNNIYSCSCCYRYIQYCIAANIIGNSYCMRAGCYINKSMR